MSANQNPPKRPRLSLQIKAISSGPNLRASRTIAAVVNPTSPTSFNTLSNVYATAIDRSTPVTAINTKQPLKIHTQNLAQSHTPYGAPTPFSSTYPETPLTAQPISPAVAGLQEVPFPSTMTATPPLSAGPVDSNDPKPFLFAPADTISSSTTSRSATTATTTTTSTPTSAGANASAVRRRATAPLTVPNRPAGPLPYMRNRSLHSILRNSPLPPPTAKTPTSPRRQSQRLAEKAARRVGYESPIERVIVTNRYVESPIDLLLADDGSNSGGGSPASVSASVAAAVLALPSSQSAVSSSSSPSSPSLDHILDRTSDETRDGGMTPGPFEEIRRRMAGLVTRTPTSPAAGSPAGVRKRRKRETKRRWVWTIGTLDDEEEEGEEAEVGGAIAAMRAAARVQTQTHGETLSLSAVTTGTTSSSSSSNNNSSNSLPPVTVDLPVVLSPMDILTPSVETFEQVPDVVMSEPEAEAETVRVVERRALSLTPGDMMDIDMVTPTVARGSHRGHLEPTAPRSTRQDSEGLFNPETGSRRDTPVPADLVATA